MSIFAPSIHLLNGRREVVAIGLTHRLIPGSTEERKMSTLKALLKIYLYARCSFFSLMISRFYIKKSLIPPVAKTILRKAFFDPSEGLGGDRFREQSSGGHIGFIAIGYAKSIHKVRSRNRPSAILLVPPMQQEIEDEWGKGQEIVIGKQTPGRCNWVSGKLVSGCRAIYQVERVVSRLRTDTYMALRAHASNCCLSSGGRFRGLLQSSGIAVIPAIVTQPRPRATNNEPAKKTKTRITSYLISSSTRPSSASELYCLGLFNVPRFYAGKLSKERLQTNLKEHPCLTRDSNPEPPASQIGGAPIDCTTRGDSTRRVSVAALLRRALIGWHVDNSHSPVGRHCRLFLEQQIADPGHVSPAAMSPVVVVQRKCILLCRDSQLLLQVDKSCRTMPLVDGPSPGSPDPPPPPPRLHSRAATNSLRFILIGSKDLEFKNHPNLFTHSQQPIIKLTEIWGSGGAVVERLACSPPNKAIRVRSRLVRSRIFACGNHAGRCRLPADFLGVLPFPPLLHSSTSPS
ncbi:hypothetical protein PR048_028406 [Dryococelus australis]|uniref:Maturase n=1 Tax=Dryococelus australis TaxID=614101 RepID=A0ABQ9GEC1_9NEOP|nr:hypothetical protein PR048_028406 [Dryococelus australis]